jgi:hypothetical protein
MAKLGFMLVPVEMREKGLCHEDFFVRCGVLESFTHDPRPRIETTRAAIAAIDRFGWEEGFQWPHMLTGLPHDQDTIEWTFKQLADRSHRRPPAKMRAHFAHWLSQASPQLLAANLERLLAAFPKPEPPLGREIFGGLSRGVADYLQAAKDRVQFASESDSHCLVLLEKLFDECDATEEFPHAEVRRIELLCERLAKAANPARMRQLVSQWLNRGWDAATGVDQWRIGSAVQLAGCLQHGEAVGPLIDLLEADWDWLNQEIEEALAKMLDRPVLEEIADRFDHLSDHARLFISGALVKAHFAGAETFIKRLLETEPDDFIQLNLGKTLALCGTESSMEAAGDLLEMFDGHPESGQIVETLYAFYRLSGHGDLDDLVRWRNQLEGEYRRMRSIQLERN